MTDYIDDDCIDYDTQNMTGVQIKITFDQWRSAITGT